MIDFAQSLKRVRERHKLSKNKLAALSGIDRAYLSVLESGRIKTITLDMAERLAKGMGISTSEFVKEIFEDKYVQ